MIADDKILREQLVETLRGGQAHANIVDAVKDFPPEHYGSRPKGAPYSAWQLLEHIRIALNDILDFSTNPRYAALNWPGDYWPKQDAPPKLSDWDASFNAISADLEAFESLIRNPESNLYARIPWGDGQTLLREVLLVIDHNSYHIGQLVMLRKELGDWKG
ncbi:MAG TPA: DinB family protein [Acidobacteriaceae bacterium]|nr:DinB family protein [Acidobacteriaceae bacterium]